MLFKKKKRTYHVSYNFKNKVGCGFGSMTIMMDKKIKTTEDVDGIRKFITESNDFENVVIINWIELK